MFSLVCYIFKLRTMTITKHEAIIGRRPPQAYPGIE